MRYIFSIFVAVSIVLVALQLVAPVGATTGITVSGERIGSKSLQINTLQRKIRVIMSEIKKTQMAIENTKKKIEVFTQQGRSTTILSNRLQTLQAKEQRQKNTLIILSQDISKLKQ